MARRTPTPTVGFFMRMSVELRSRLQATTDRLNARDPATRHTAATVVAQCLNLTLAAVDKDPNQLDLALTPPAPPAPASLPAPSLVKQHEASQLARRARERTTATLDAATLAKLAAKGKRKTAPKAGDTNPRRKGK